MITSLFYSFHRRPIRICIYLVFIAAAFAQDASQNTDTQTITATPPPFVLNNNNVYKQVVKGSLQDPKNYKVYTEDSTGKFPLSNWHDIPLAVEENKIYNMIVEVPRGDSLMTLINLGEEINPITTRLDVNGTAQNERIDYIHNFGKLPQTYSNPDVTDGHSTLPGTGNPLDAVEISERVHNIGDIIKVKILGALGMIQNGAADWKIIAFDINSPNSDHFNSLDDINNTYPDLLQSTRGYFRFYRFPDVLNNVISETGYVDANTAQQIIAEKNKQWQDLITHENPPDGIVTTSHQPGAAQADDQKWLQILNS